MLTVRSHMNLPEKIDLDQKLVLAVKVLYSPVTQVCPEGFHADIVS
jgi:hypothetical protein